MKLLFIILIFVLADTGKSWVYSRVKGCKHMFNYYKGIYVRCNNIEQHQLPLAFEPGVFEYLHLLYVQGSFTSFSLHPGLFYIDILVLNSTHLDQFNFANFQHLDTLKKIYITDGRMKNFNFSGIEKINYLKTFDLTNQFPVKVDSCTALKQLPDLTTLGFYPKNFDLSCLPPNLKNLWLQQFETLSSVESLKNMSTLRDLYFVFGTQQRGNDVFDFENLPQGLEEILLHSSNYTIAVTGSKYLNTFTDLEILDLHNVSGIVFEYLPRTLKRVVAVETDFPEFIDGDVYCDYLRNLSALNHLDLSRNNITTFDLTCLPGSIEHIDLSRNAFTTFNFTSLAYTRSNRFDKKKLIIAYNPFDCDCLFLETIGNLSLHVDIVGIDEELITCTPESELSYYPWHQSFGTLSYYDHLYGYCLSNATHELLGWPWG